MNNGKKTQLKGFMLAVAIIVSGFVCLIYIQPSTPGIVTSYDVKNFGSYEELTGFLNGFESNSRNYYSQDLVPGAMVEDMAMTMDSTAEKNSLGGTTVDYSQTNIQVAGVDEPDIVKTDGTYLYIVSQNRVLIVKAYPSENATIEAIITVDINQTIINIFISEDRLVIFTNSYINYPILYQQDVMVKTMAESSYISPWYSSPDTYIKIYDLETITSPELVKDIIVGGSFSSARLIGDYIYVITTQYSYNTVGYGENFTIVPRLIVNDEPIDVPLTNIYYVDIPEKSNTLTNILSVNIMNDTEEVHEKIFLLGTSQTLFVSQENIYVTYSNGYYYNYTALQKLVYDALMPYLPDSVKSQLDTVNTLNLNKYQKQEVISWILQNSAENLVSEQQKTQLVRQIIQQTEFTIVHRISINNGEITYEAQGSVPGYVNNQFSLDEYNGYLRVSTTVQGSSVSYLLGSITPETNVYVLDMDLKIVGSREDISSGTGEQIYATRFVGNICYLVTFRQTDPFFVIDLSDPANPIILGELEIPGYSTYLHPYDETHIIGIGKIGGNVKLALFDVTDMTNPVELGNYTITTTEDNWWTDSTALYEHKAFLFSKEKNLLVIPAGSWAKQSAYVFDISVENGINFKGNISHDIKTTQPDDGVYYDYYYDYGNTIQRSLYIENVLYTISTNQVKMNDLSSLTELNSIAFVETN